MFGIIMPHFRKQRCPIRSHSEQEDICHFPEILNPLFLSKPSKEGNRGKIEAEHIFPRVESWSGLLDDLMYPLFDMDGYRSCSSRQQKRKCQPMNWVKRIILPSFEPEDVTIKVESDNLVVHASHEEVQNGNSSRYEVNKTVPIPTDVDKSKITARLIFGHILKLEAPKLPGNSSQTKTKLDRSDENDDVMDETQRANDKETAKEPQVDDIIQDVKELKSFSEEISRTKESISDENPDSVLSGFEQVDIDKTDEQENKEGIGKTMRKNEIDHVTNSRTDLETIFDDISKPDSLSLKDDSVFLSPRKTTESVKVVDRDGKKYHEIHFDTQAFDPASVSVRCRGSHLSVCATNNTDTSGCEMHQEARQVLKLPDDVDLGLLKGFMDNNGILIVSAPYKSTSTGVTEIPIRIDEE